METIKAVCWRRALLLLLGFAVLVPAAWAQLGTLTGVVVDAESGETLIGVNVLIQGTLTGTSTDLDGRYQLSHLEPGLYNVVFSYIGFQTMTVQNVEITAGTSTRLDVSLAAEAIGLDEVVIEAAAVRNAEAALLKDRQKAAAVSDAISAEAIGRSGSSTASDAMQKVTGASVVGGKYVYVRGLGDRYMNTQLNGAALPSADPDRNSVPFDLFPSGLLDNIITTKTFTPDQPGNFTGGSVNIATKSYPEAFSLSLSSSAGYNSQVGLGGEYLALAQGNTFLGTRTLQMPALLEAGTRIPAINEVYTNKEKAAQLDQMTRAFGASMAPTAVAAPVNQGYSLSVGNQMPLLGRPFGFVGSLTFSRNVSAYTGGVTARFKGGRDVATSDDLTTEYNLSDSRGADESLYGGLLRLSYKLTPRHELGFNYIQNQSAESVARYQVGTLAGFGGGANDFYETRTLHYTERLLRTFQARGQHAFTSRNIRAEWSTSLARTNQEEPDLRFFSNNYSVEDGDTAYVILPSLYPVPTRYFRNLEEDDQSAQLDLTVPFRQWSQRPAQLKVGGAYQVKTRTFRERFFEFRQDVRQNLYDGDPSRYFAQFAGLQESFSTATFNRFGLYVTEASTPANSYDGDQTIAAAYAMVDLPLAERLRLITGARLETTQITTQSLDSLLNASGRGLGELDNRDVLPSVNLVFQAMDNMNLRTAYSRTLARPTFRELAPYPSFTFVGDYIFIGNPNLKRTLVDNFDVRWEWFMRPGEILAVSGFYKDFTNPIERVILNDNGEIQPQNVDEAAVFGAEFEVRKRLDGLGSLLRHLQVGGNLALVASRVRIAPDELELRRAVDPSTSETRSLQGQSPFVVNLDVTYDNPGTGTLVSAYYNVFGDRLAEVSIGGTPDVFESTDGDLDVTLAQRLPMGFRLKLAAKNLLGADYLLKQTFKGEDYVVRSYDRGRSFSVGLSYSLD